MAIVALALVLTSSFLLYLHITNHESEMLERTTVLSTSIGRHAQQNIILGNPDSEANYMRILEESELVLNAHIYRVEENDELSFFASYNRSGQAAVQPMYHRIEELNTAKFIDNSFVETITPILDSGIIVGYAFVRVDARDLKQKQVKAVFMVTGVIFGVLCICFFITLKVQRMLTAPIKDLVDVVQIIAQKKDYSQRAKHTSVRELDHLIRAFNTMISRIQEHVQRQEEVEHEYRDLAANLEETVNQRTQALKEANAELIQTLEKLHQFQRQMVENEKMASLGDMVAGVAHEVNTPIGLGVTASTMMLDRLAKIKEDFENKTLKASSLEKFIGESEENLNIIYRNLNRSAELISSFKQVAVDQSTETDRIFMFRQLMDEVLLSLRPRLKSVNHQIHIECPAELKVESKAGPINQIMINLIMNSLIHGFEEKSNGNVYIEAKISDNSTLEIDYRDDGKGIPENIRTRIFDPFVTTKRGQGGSGLGMHLVYNLVTQALNGNISVASNEGNGVEFKITFPVKILE